MYGTAYDAPVDWLVFPLPSDNYVQVHVHANFLMSRWMCIYGTCPGLIEADDKTFAADVGCCGDGFYVTDAADLVHVEAMISKLTDADWDAENRADVIAKGYKRGAKDDAEALTLGWRKWMSKPKSGNVMPTDDEDWSLKSRVRDGACVFANRSTGGAGSQGCTGCAFLHLGAREARERIVSNGEGAVDSITAVNDEGIGDARHDISMPDICHSVPLRIVYEDDYDDDGNKRLSKITIRPWDADEWPGDNASEYAGSWWCVDDPATYVAETALHTRMRGTIEGALGKDGYTMLADLLEQRAATIAPMPVLTKPDITGGRPLIPLAVANKTMKRPHEDFEKRWKDDLYISANRVAYLVPNVGCD